MKNSELILIAALAKNNVIGKNGEIPWKIKEDMKHFKNITQNYPVIMGRKTYESIIRTLKHPLPNRRNMIISKNPDFKPDGVEVYNNLSFAIDVAKNYRNKVFIIGGENIYRQTMDIADRLEITHINRDFEGDSFFPEIDLKKWQPIYKESHFQDKLEFTFSTYLRRGNNSEILDSYFNSREIVD
jgi:dihydrofolate reductase